MNQIRRRKWVIALLALAFVVLFAGCKGEGSPTAPPTTTGGGGTTGGTTPPPAGAAVTLSVTNPTPVTDGVSVVTATVTQNGQPVPNGTAVEFATNLGTLCAGTAGCTDTSATTPVQGLIRTTNGGIATVAVTSSSAGTATIQAVVNNVKATTTVRFQTIVQPPNNDTTVAITAITPALGRPAGGETITITGKNFKAPVRVLFDGGNGNVKEAQVVSVSPTAVTVLTPAFDVGAGQQKKVTITLINEAGSSSEARVSSAANAFTYQTEQLTPSITTVSPASGPINGDTRVTIFGSGFQAPVQVFFGSAEATVVSSNFNQIVVLSPPGSATSSNGSGAVLGPVDVRVININSATTSNTLTGGFRYTPKMQVTLAGPTQGPYTGGTEVRIDGVGFDDPLTVVFAGFAGGVLRVSGTEILAVTAPIIPPGCADVVGPIVVTNGENGDTANGPQWRYIVPKPGVISVTAAGGGAIVAGSTVNIRVANADPNGQIRLGDTTVNVNSVTQNPDGTFTYNVTVPQLPLQTQTCAGTTRDITTGFDVTFTNSVTQCTTTAAKALQLSPPQVGNLFVTPNPLTVTARAGQAGPPVITPAPGSGAVQITNNGAAQLTITAVNSTCPAGITVNPPSLPTTLQPCDVAVISVTATPGAPGTAQSCQATITATSGSSTITRNVSIIANTQ